MSRLLVQSSPIGKLRQLDRLPHLLIRPKCSLECPQNSSIFSPSFIMNPYSLQFKLINLILILLPQSLRIKSEILEYFINFNIMSTFILKTRANKSKNDSLFRVQSCRQKVPLVLQEGTSQLEAKKQSKSHRLHLPCIYQTQNLLAKNNNKHSRANKENEYLPIKLIDRKIEHSKNRNKLNAMKRHNTDVKERQESAQKVYHNFIKKKEVRNKVYMQKIIDRVISDAIEPWSLQRIRQKQGSNLYYYEPGSSREDSLQMTKQRLI